MSSPGERASVAAIVAHAVLYALAVTLLVLYAPGADYAFIYQGF